MKWFRRCYGGWRARRRKNGNSHLPFGLGGGDPTVVAAAILCSCPAERGGRLINTLPCSAVGLLGDALQVTPEQRTGSQEEGGNGRPQRWFAGGWSTFLWPVAQSSLQGHSFFHSGFSLHVGLWGLALVAGFLDGSMAKRRCVVQRL